MPSERTAPATGGVQREIKSFDEDQDWEEDYEYESD